MVYVKEDFFQAVWAVVRAIPEGRVTSYGAIAKVVGTGKSSRMVGWAMNASHGAQPPVPAHRVVNRLGLLTGRHHFADEMQMERLLAAEGIAVNDNQVVDFARLYWDPMQEYGEDV